MSNGNGTDLYDSAPISKWVRPGVAIAGAIEGFILLGYDAMYALTRTEPSLAIIAVVGAIAGVGLGYAAWYFGVRNQDKGISTLKSTVTELMSLVKTQNGGIPPKADNGQSASTDEGDSSVEPEPQPKVYEFFNEDAFDFEIESSVVNVYTVKNAATKFYHVWNRAVVTDRYDTKDSKWSSYLRKIVNLYFSEIWGLKDEAGNLIDTKAVEYATEHINDAKGCTTCSTALSCQWQPSPTESALERKARYMGVTSYWLALDWVNKVEKYLKA